MDSTRISGNIEVVLEDKDGNKKSHQITHNNLTRAALFQTLYGGLSANVQLNKLLHVDKALKEGQHIRVNQGACSLYVLSQPLLVSSKQIYRPFYNSDQSTRNAVEETDISRVPFWVDSEMLDKYEAGISVTESTALAPFIRNCAFIPDSVSATYTFEYRNTEGLGLVSAVMLGQTGTELLKSPLGIRISPRKQEFPTSTLAAEGALFGNGHYCICHFTQRGARVTTVWKGFASNGLTTYNVTNDTYAPETPYPDFITDDLSGGLLLVCDSDIDSGNGFALVKAYIKGSTLLGHSFSSLAGNTADTYTITLEWKKDVLDNPNSVSFKKDITYTVPSGQTLNVTRKAVPVLVLNGDILEMFFTGEHCVEDATKCNLYKYTIPVSNFATAPSADALAVSAPQLVGKLPYCIGNHTPSIADVHYLLGYYDSNRQEYYLPVSKVYSGGDWVDCGAVVSDSGQITAANVLGVRIRPTARYGDVGMRSEDVAGWELFASNVMVTNDQVTSDSSLDFGTYQFVAGKVSPKQMVLCGNVVEKSFCTVIQDTVWAAANLQTPIEKEEDDVLRVIWTYELGNSSSQSLSCESSISTC